MSALSERLIKAKGGRSIDDIVEAAARRGHSIDRSGVARYLQPKHPKPRAVTIEALAAGFGVDAREIRELAGRPAGELGPWIPPAESASLPQEVRDAFDQLIRAVTKTGAPPVAEDVQVPDAAGDPPADAELLEFPGSAGAPEDQDDGDQPAWQPGYKRTAARRGPRRNVDGEENRDPEA